MAEPLTARRLATEVAAGMCGGFASALVGHPLDTIKTRMQSDGGGQAFGRSPSECIRRTLASEGVFALYRGAATPLAMSGVLNAVMFTVNMGSRRVVAHARGCAPADLSMADVVLSSWLTAPIYSLAVAPVDVIKTRLQVQQSAQQSPTAMFRSASHAVVGSLHNVRTAQWWPAACQLPVSAASSLSLSSVSVSAAAVSLPSPTHVTSVVVDGGGGVTRTSAASSAAAHTTSPPPPPPPPSYRGPVDVLVQTLRTDGVRGVFRGYQATVAMRFVGLPGYFGGYEACKRALLAVRDGDTFGNIGDGSTRAPPSPTMTMIAGGSGGLSFWMINYPLDLAKTKIQTFRGTGAPPTVVATVHQLLSSGGGVRALYRGASPCFARAFPANAAVFSGVEYGRRLFGENGGA